MHKNLLLFFFILVNQLTCVAFSPVDSNYVQSLKTVQFYPYYGIQKDVILPPVKALSDSINLRIEFDLLENNTRNLQASIYLCDANWELTQTNEVNYLEDYNEFDILDAEFSFITKVPYTHYFFDIPTISLPGNYILAIYESDTQIPILSRRFMVHSKKAEIIISDFFRQANTSTKQQIDFSVKLNSNEIRNPMSNVRVYLRQNGCDYTRTEVLKPSFYRAYENMLEFNLIDGSNAFNAGSTYRKIDMRSTNFSGFHIAKVDESTAITQVYVVPDETRRYKPMEQLDDIYGRYLIDHYEFDDGAINSDYILTMFTLDFPKVDGDIYIFGQLSDWKIKSEFKLEYNADYQRYAAAPLIKQGYYNYMYVLVKDGKIDPVFFEGSHRERNNYYEVLVYHRIPGQLEEELIGYERVFIYR